MRESKTIRRTFPGTADSPGGKELVTEVAAMDMSVETKTEGLGGVTTKQEVASVTGGVPKPVKKTFAEAMTKQELEQRMKGSALSTNAPAAPDAAPVARKAELKQTPRANRPRHPVPPRSPVPSIPSGTWCAISTSNRLIGPVLHGGFRLENELFQLFEAFFSR